MSKSRHKSVSRSRSRRRSRSGKRKHIRQEKILWKTDNDYNLEREQRSKIHNYNHVFNRKITEFPHLMTNFSEAIKPQEDEIHFRSCYFVGIPKNVQGNHIYQELIKRRIDYPDKFDIISKSNNFSLKKDDNTVDYFSLIFREKRFVDIILEEGFEVFSNPILVLPSLSNVIIQLS